MSIKTLNTTISFSVVTTLLAWVAISDGWAIAMVSQDETVEVKNLQSDKRGHLIKVSLPIDGHSAAQVRQSLAQIVDSSTDLVRADDRPVVVLEFDTSRGATGQGSSLGACIDLARYLSSSELNRIKTVTYIPGRKVAAVHENQNVAQTKTKLIGHAVLVALSANQIAIDPSVSIGSAGIDESAVDAFVVEAYKNVVSKRLTMPVPVALAMLKKKAQLFRVRTADGIVYADSSDLKKLEEDGSALDTETMSTTSKLAEFTGQQLVDFGLIRQATSSRVELGRQLGIDQSSLKAESKRDEPWKAVYIKLPDYVDETTLQWVTRSLDPKIANKQANLIILEFDSSSGDVDACLLFARRLAAYDPNEIRTVAFVNKSAAGPAALLAMSCYHVIMQNDAMLGGMFEPSFAADRLPELKATAAGIAGELEKDSAMFQAMIDPDMRVIRFRDKKTGQERLFTQAERDAQNNADNWLPQGPQNVFDPIGANVAQKLDLARQVVSGFEELKSFYQLNEEPEMLTPTSVDRWLHQTALFLASPFVAPWLLFLAMFFLFNEISQPGLGVPGFLGTICLILYFWSQHLDGNANWLEIMLFGAGALFLLLEMFVVPGFGVFGIGGLIMVVVSIVLASQTFIFPTNSEQFNQLPKSMFALIGALGGTVFAMVVLRTVLPKTPFFKKIMLEPPTRSADEFDDGTDSESMVNWGHLIGLKGTAITNLVPAGKAKIDGRLIDVISDGRLIEKGQAIEVIDVAGNRVVVAAVESG